MHVRRNPVAVKREAPGTDGPVTSATLKQASPYEDVHIEEAEELEAGEVVKDEDDDDDAMLNAIENAIRVTEAEEKAAVEDGTLGVGTSSEQTFNGGMASTLNILRQQGLPEGAMSADDCPSMELYHLYGRICRSVRLCLGRENEGTHQHSPSTSKPRAPSCSNLGESESE